MCEKYNGWTNRETWLVGVHGFFDDEWIQEALRDAISNNSLCQGYGYDAITRRQELGGVPRAWELWLADWMEQQMDDYLSDSDEIVLSPIVKDLMGDHKINWLEIAEHYREQIADIRFSLWTK